MTTDYSAYKIPVESGINDIPVAPTETHGCNGAYYIEKYNSFLDNLDASPYTTSVTSSTPTNSPFTLSTSTATSLVILRNYQSLGITILTGEAFTHCTVLNDTDFDIPIVSGSDANFVYMSNFPPGSRGAGASHLLLSKSRLNVYLVGTDLYLEGGIISTAAGS